MNQRAAVEASTSNCLADIEMYFQGALEKYEDKNWGDLGLELELLLSSVNGGLRLVRWLINNEEV